MSPDALLVARDLAAFQEDEASFWLFLGAMGIAAGGEMRGKPDGYIVQILIDHMTCDIGVGALKTSLPFPFEKVAPGCSGVLLVFAKRTDAEEYARQSRGADICEFWKQPHTGSHREPREGS